MRHGSLFSGIGGFDLASEWMGWENVFHCEWNEFGQKVLKYYWPKAILYHDITKTDFTIHRGTIDILTGGFPCQPYSSAGKRLGKEDSRHLWPEMLRTIREIQPTYVVGENVRGLTNWNGGLVFDEVQADLEAEGYEVTPFLLPACAVNAPHRRDRIWFVAYSKNSRINGINGNDIGQTGKNRAGYDKSNGFSQSGTTTDSKSNDAKRISEFNNNKWQNSEEKRSGFWNEFRSNGSIQDVTDTISIGHNGESKKTRPNNTFANGRMEQKIGQHRDKIWSEAERCSTNNSRGRIQTWESFPTQSPICTRDDGIPNRLDSITFSKWRQESIKAGGNAIVPQVVYQIFKAIEQYETTRNTQTAETK